MRMFYVKYTTCVRILSIGISIIMLANIVNNHKHKTIMKLKH
jgi:hypothetical protein